MPLQCRITNCIYGRVYYCFVYMTTMYHHIILIDLNNETYRFTRTYVMISATMVFHFLQVMIYKS